MKMNASAVSGVWLAKRAEGKGRMKSLMPNLALYILVLESHACLAKPTMICRLGRLDNFAFRFSRG
jgi:hypothetical protein